MTANITLSDTAARRITTLAADGKGAILRLAILGGGCSGFQYDFTRVDAPESDDLVITHLNATAAIDASALPLLDGAVIDFENTLAASRFVVTNPNATANCGCGVSFSI